VVAAAGLGKRMGRDKVFLSLSGKPLFLHAVERLLAHEDIDAIVVVAREDAVDRVKEDLEQLSGDKSALSVVPGGRHRQDSVWNALEFLAQEEPPEYVLVQDGARPFLTESMITDSLRVAKDSGAACVAVRALDTLKHCIDGDIIGETLDRSRIWQAQTPQAFEFSLLFESYKRMRETGEIRYVTDDASVLERLGHEVRLVEGSPFNIKITRPEDIELAQAIADRLACGSV